MSETKERVADVVEEMKRTSTAWIKTLNVLGVMPTRQVIYDWADRIGKAHKLEMDFLRLGNGGLAENYREAVAEIERLETALKKIEDASHSHACQAGIKSTWYFIYKTAKETLEGKTEVKP